MMLHTLAPEDWRRQTRAPQWQVGDVVAHLLDTAIRRLSAWRDSHVPPAPDRDVTSLSDLTAFIDALNAEWIAASRRVSPRLTIELLDVVGRQLGDFFGSAELDAPARLSVAWAGEAQSAASLSENAVMCSALHPVIEHRAR